MNPEQYPSYTVSPELPDWVQTGHTQFQNAHGGPAETAKDILLQASTIGYSFDDLMQADQIFFGRLTPDVVWDWTVRYTDKFLDEMESLGKDLIQVTWSCGFSTKSEAIQRKIVTQFTQKAHKRGIRICAYLSLTNVYWKDAFEHEPELEGVVAKLSNGKPMLYAYSQARYLACVNQPAWLEYLKKKIRMALEDAKVDAIYFDNLAGACACSTCRNMFGDFTERLISKRYDLPEIKQIFPPNAKMAKGQAMDEQTVLAAKKEQVLDDDDKVCRDYLHRRFCAHRLAEALKELREFAFALKFPLAFSANNHLAPFVNDVCNVLYSQDTMTPGPKWSNIPYLRYLAAESFNFKPVLTNHALKDSDPRLSMAEAMAFQSYPYGITHKPYNLFYKDHPELFTDVRPVAKIGVIWEWPKRLPKPDRNYLQPLGMNNLLYEVILADHWSKDALQKFSVILLPDLEAVSDKLCDALCDYQKNGGTVLATGMSLLFDGFGRRRKDLPNLKPGDGISADRIGQDVLDELRQASNPQLVEVDGDSWVVVNLVRKTDGSAYILHVLNYKPTSSRRAKIKLSIPGQTFSKATLYSPDDPSGQRNLVLTDGSCFSLEDIGVYSLIWLE